MSTPLVRSAETSDLTAPRRMDGSEEQSPGLNAPRRLLGPLVRHEWRRFRSSPVWMVGLGCAAALAWSETGSSQVLGYPSPNQALYGFQLASSVVYGLIAFLLASSSLAADLEPCRRDLIASRPAPKSVYIAAKFLGASTFTLCALIPLLLFSAAAPLWNGVLRIHSLSPFLLAATVCSTPMVAFSCGFALLTTALFRRVVIVLPLFLVLFFVAALLNPAAPGTFNWLDFSHRLYPRDLVIDVPVRLTEITFSGLLSPVSPALLAKTASYFVLSAGLVCASWGVIRLQMQTSLSRGWLRKKSRGPMGSRANRDRPHALMQPWLTFLSARLPGWADAEARLFYYSGRMLVGRNLASLLIVMGGLLAIVFSYQVGRGQTRESVLLLQLELFAPLIGVVMLSDLMAVEFEARRADLLRASVCGLRWLVLRRVLHAIVFTLIASVGLLLVFRVLYTGFDLALSLFLVLPGALFFGLLGALAAGISRHALVGYAVGALAMLVWSAAGFVDPLGSMSYFARERLNNGTLFTEWNWMSAKLVYAAFALGLLGCVLRVAAAPARWKGPIALAVTAIALVHVAARHAWSLGNGTSEEPGLITELSRIVTNETMVVRRVQSSSRLRGGKPVYSTTLLDIEHGRQGTNWGVRQERPVHLTREWDLSRLNLDLAVTPAKGALTGKASFPLKYLGSGTEDALLYLAPELQVHRVTLDGRPTTCQAHGALLQIRLPRLARSGDEFLVEMEYEGELSLPQNVLFEHASREVLMVASRFYPSLWQQSGEPKNLFQCTARVHVPLGYHMAAARLLERTDRGSTFLWETSQAVESVPLCVGRFTVESVESEGLKISVCGTRLATRGAQRILKDASAIVRGFEQWFGRVPHRELAIVEYPHQGAGAHALSSLVLIRPERFAAENTSLLHEGYLGHEIAHQWFGNDLPPWIAESVAVFANYEWLVASIGQARARDFQDREIFEPFFRQAQDKKALLSADGTALYAKGGYFLIMLENVLGHEKVLAILRRFRAQAKQHKTLRHEEQTDLFLRILRTEGGPRFDRFVLDWTGSIKIFDPALRSLRSERRGDHFVTSVQVSHDGEIRFPLKVTLRLDNGAQQLIEWDGTASEQTLEFVSTVRVVSAELDAEHKLLDNRANNRIQAGQTIATAGHNRGAARDCTAYTEADGLPGTDIRCLARGNAGEILAAAHSFNALVNRNWAVAVFQREQWRPYAPTVEPVHLITSAVATSDGWWFGSQGQLSLIRGEQSRRLTAGEIRTGGALGGGVFCSNPQSKNSFPGSHVYALKLDKHGSLWVGTDHGVSVLNQSGEVTHHYSRAQGLAGQDVFALEMDHQGRIWAGTDQGVFQLDGPTWHRAAGSPSDLVLGLAISKDTTLWCATYRSGIVALPTTPRIGISAVTYDWRNSAVPHTICSCICVDAGWGVWVGTPDGVLRFDGRVWTTFNRQNSGLPSDRVHAVVAGTVPGEVYVASAAGVARLAAGENTPKTPYFRGFE